MSDSTRPESVRSAQRAQRLRRGSAPSLRRAVVGAPLSLVAVVAIGCGGGPPPAAPKDVEFAQAMSTGRSAFDRGDADQAALFFAQALRRAEARDDAADIGDAAYNLAVSLLPSRAYDRAAGLLAESRRELTRIGATVVDVRLMEARCAYRAGDPATADAVAAEVAASPAAAPAEKADALLLRGEVALDRGDPAAAGRLLVQSRFALPVGGNGTASSAGANHDLTAGWLGLDGKLAEADGQPGKAAQSFDRQAAACQAGRLYAEMSDALRRAARAHAAAGDHRSAADRWYRASRSLTAQGDVVAGAAAAREAVAEADRAGDPGLAAGLPRPATGPATGPVAATQPGPETRPSGVGP